MPLMLSKEDFLRMEILGQFNAGFILCHLPAKIKSDQDYLIIIDQHAAEERYNFEDLLDNTIFTKQPLIKHELLQLSSLNKLLIEDNRTTFEQNGFEFKIQQVDDIQQIYLTAKPMSKNHIFDASDIENLCYKLQDESSSKLSKIIRPDKVIKILASRSCRKSVMIGDLLNKKQMEKIVRKLHNLKRSMALSHGRNTVSVLSKMKFNQ